jgi:hypothetical protein
MLKKIRLLLIILIVMAMALPLPVSAAVVGRFSLVRGEVDVLKAGKIPAVPAKFQDGVEPGDIIRTKANGKAQLTMVDDSVITLAPESRLAIADYQYNPDRQDRRAVLRLFRGLVHTVVNRIIKTEEPDFILETHTATIGVRGTNWYTLQGPSITLAALRYGILSVGPIAPGPAAILLHSMQYIQVPKPFVIQVLTPEILKMLEQMMDTGIKGSAFEFGLPAIGPGGLQTPFTLPGSPDQKLKIETIPPTLVPQQQVPAPVQPAPSRGPGPSIP